MAHAQTRLDRLVHENGNQDHGQNKRNDTHFEDPLERLRQLLDPAWKRLVLPLLPLLLRFVATASFHPDDLTVGCDQAEQEEVPPSRHVDTLGSIVLAAAIVNMGVGTAVGIFERACVPRW